jgi:hypothetical protein
MVKQSTGGVLCASGTAQVLPWQESFSRWWRQEFWVIDLTTYCSVFSGLPEFGNAHLNCWRISHWIRMQRTSSYSMLAFGYKLWLVEGLLSACYVCYHDGNFWNLDLLGTHFGIIEPLRTSCKLRAEEALLAMISADPVSFNQQEYFTKSVGPVKSLIVSYNKNGDSRGIANITFSNGASAAKAYKELNSIKVDGRPMKVEMNLCRSQTYNTNTQSRSRSS